MYLLSPGWSPKQVINLEFEWARVTCSDRYIFCYYKHVACPVLGDFGAILAVAVSDLLPFLVLLFHHPRKGGESDTFIPHLLWWLLLFLPCCNLTGSDHLWVQQSPSAGRRIHISSCWCWISCSLDMCHRNLQKIGVFLKWYYCILGRYTSQNYPFKTGATGISFVFTWLNTWRNWIYRFWLWVKPQCSVLVSSIGMKFQGRIANEKMWICIIKMPTLNFMSYS